MQQTLKWGGGGILKSLYATLGGLHNCLEFSQHSCVYIRLMQTQKKFFYHLLEYNVLQ